ncbi:cache domain-containing protein, partial [Helicobacter sp.]|uniref:cache domain-containing protein n=1 Tax=Helicobacter sp. TaxID=218 RepID=UPI0025C635B9
MFGNLKLGTRLSLLLAIIVIICMGVMTAVVVSISTSVQTKEAKKLLQNTSLRAANAIQGKFNQTFAFADTLRSTIEATLKSTPGYVMREGDLIATIVEETLDADKDSVFIYLYLKNINSTRNGTILPNGDFLLILGDNDVENQGGLYHIPASETILNFGSVQKALQTGKPTIGEPTIQNVDGRKDRLVVGLNVPIHDINGRPVGAVGLVVDLEDIGNWVNSPILNAFEGDYRVVMTESGTIGTHPNSSFVSKNISEINRDTKTIETIKNASLRHQNGVYDYKTTDGKEALVGLSSFGVYDAANWTVLFVAPLKSILQPVHTLQYTIIIGAIVSIIVILVCVFLYIRTAVIGRLQVVSGLLTNFFKYLNHETKTPPNLVKPKANDEIGTMTAAINRNIESVQEGLRKDSQAIAQSAETAKAVEDGDLTARIVENPHNPQLIELKNVLNNMLDV